MRDARMCLSDPFAVLQGKGQLTTYWLLRTRDDEKFD